MGGPQVEDPAPEAQPTRPPGPVRRVLTWLGVIALVVSAVLGSNLFSVRDKLFGSAVPEPARPAANRNAFTPIHNTARVETSLRSNPWWQNLTSLHGTSTVRSLKLTIGAGAIQWRVKTSCRSGRLLVRVAGQPEPLVDTACSKDAVGSSQKTGAKRIDVQADGPWRLEVSQQIDAPLVEPPLRTMTASGARQTATGSFYKIDQTGTGKVTVYRQADGRYSMRLNRFFVTPNADLELRLSPRKAPRSSKQFLSAPSRRVGRMDVTAGSFNYAVPAGIDPSRYQSLVIWCAATRSAYAAARLEAAR